MAPENLEYSKAGMFIATLILGMIYGLLIEVITTVVFKAKYLRWITHLFVYKNSKLPDTIEKVDIKLFHEFILRLINRKCELHIYTPVKRDVLHQLAVLNKEHYTNYFIASAPNNKYLQKAIDIVVENIQQRNIDKGVYSLTGPIVLNRAIGDDEVNHRYYKYTCVQGSFTNEYFQYIDKPRGKWTYAKKEDLLKDW